MTKLLTIAVATLALCCSVTVAQFTTCFQSVDTATASSNAFDFSGVDKFGMPLLRNLSALMTNPNENLLISPFSIWSVLSLALMGAKGNSKTQLEQALGLSSSKLQAFRTKTVLDFVMKGSGVASPNGPQMLSIDRAYFDQSLQLRECVRNVIFKLDIVDFSDAEVTANLINQDVSIATAGVIADFLRPTQIVNAEFVLINAIYFKGKWADQFRVETTRNAPFTITQSSGRQNTFNVPMMSRQAKMKIAHSQVMAADVLELPYRDSTISMFIILPTNASTRIEDTLQNLTPFSFLDVRNSMRELLVKLNLPRFDLETKIETELIQALESMGISDIFNPRVSDFSDFTKTSLFVSSAIHQAKVKVDEEGTVAAAATGLVATRRGPGQFIPFIVDRPFIFLIYDKRTSVTLFSGIVKDPRA